MKKLYYLLLVIVLAFLIGSVPVLFSGCTPEVTVNIKTECDGLDSTEVKKLIAENAKVKKDLYWQRKRTDSCRMELIRKDGIIGDTNLFKVMRFDDKGNLITSLENNPK